MRRPGPVRLLGVLLLAGCAVTPGPPADSLSAEEHNDLGVAYFARGEPSRAAREFDRALALRPDFVRARVNLGDARLALGRVEDAIAAYEAARAAGPDDPGLLNNLAWALLQHETRWPEAEPLIHRALALGPEPRGYYLDTLGVLRLRQAQPREALVAFREALADGGLADPAVRALVLRHAGDALVRLGQADGAARCYARARALAVPIGASPKVGDEDTVC
jgi:tetratricopeptide (TPR) repeat protein